MSKREEVCIDFETEQIENRPEYPPVPAGVAIEFQRKREYLAWGHPTGNNCTKSKAKKILKDHFRYRKCIFHNAPFDIEVGMKHLDLPFPEDFEDTLVLAYLHDPRDDSLGLKEWTDKYLDLPPDEQTKLKNWILENIPEAIPSTKKNPWGAYIAKAPGNIVSPYAKGDVKRTFLMYRKLKPYIIESGMLEAYMREIKVMPRFMNMSSGGIKVAVNRLKRDLRKWEKEHKELETKIRKRLKTPDLDIASSRQLASALDKSGKVTEWIYTKPSKTFPDGQRSTKRENLIKVCDDKLLIGMLSRHGVMSTYMNTFANPWLETAERTDGYIYPTYHQTRSTEAAKGTRTGRPSSSNPNLFNVPRNPEDPEKKWTIGLPHLRNYLVPDEGNVFINRDFAQQELRILAHFEDGELLKAYLEDPKLDMHNRVQDLIHQMTGIKYPRKFIKVINFATIYGMGVSGLSQKLDISFDEAKELKADHARSLPGIKDLTKQLRMCANRDDPIRTWGGRLYYVEEPKMVMGHMRSFEYKLLNYLIQGSAADITKQAMINADEICTGRLVLQVYDELMMSVEKGTEKKQIKLMREAMLDMKGMDVPMLSDGKIGVRSWGEAKKYVDPKR